MNNQIIEINGIKMVDKDGELYFVEENGNLVRSLELENYLDYLKHQKAQFEQEICKVDYSNMKIIDIIKYSWKSGVDSKILSALGGITSGALLLLIVVWAGFDIWLGIPSIIRAIVYLAVFALGAILPVYVEAKGNKNKSKNNHINLKITKEQIEIVEKELEKIKQIIKTHCPVMFKINNEKLPEIKQLNTFNEYNNYRCVVTTTDEPISGIIRKLNR